MPSFLRLQRRLRHALVAWLATTLTVLSWLLGFAPPAFADPAFTPDDPQIQQLQQELSTLQQRQPGLSGRDAARLSDLQRLSDAVARSNDRATVSNGTTHNLGLLARYKKDNPDQPANFYVLAPGHDSDDDYAVVALYLPAQVQLDWEGATAPLPGNGPRLVTVLPGEQLVVRDAVPETVSEPGKEPAVTADASSGDTYVLNLPAYAITTQGEAVASLPRYTQDQLDAELETAPVD